ncbi:ANTAR domain-containing protein [Blastococcus deserti]|uniref:ANTAR domain-containing protein n=1 Tax=Blastococcus deserti TaxID=2259033 RepID=A0ABW4X5W5_9ACTN
MNQVIPGPRPSKGHDGPRGSRDRGTDVAVPSPDAVPDTPVVALTRTPRGWSVQSPAGSETAGDLVEGLSLADLVAEEFGTLREPDRSARRSARGSGSGTAGPLDPLEARVAELERTVAQLEHALAARVSTERAIGVLAERHGTSARAAFESLRRDARSQGRPVAELAREVLDGLAADDSAAPADPAAPPAVGGSEQPRSGRSVPAPGLRHPGAVVAAVTAPGPRAPSAGSALAATDGAS